MPGGLYEISAVRQYGADPNVECDLGVEGNYSEPLSVSTSNWGDIVGDNNAQPPNGVANFQDVAGVVDKFKNLAGAPRKSRVDVAPRLPDRIVDFQDLPAVVDAFQGKPYPYTDLPTACPPPPGVCEADIRADTNDDGLINGADDLLEDVEPLMLWTNSDDDNDNGIPDCDETDVAGENDLVELQLSAPSCSNFEWEWWGLSWEPTDAPIMVWWESDKSCSENCPKSVAARIYNSRDDRGFVYPFSWLPRSVWLEGLEPFDDLDITFTIYPSSRRKALGSLTEDPETDTAKAKAQQLGCVDINLRVVMFMEPDSNIDDPEQYTGGTKFSRADAKEIVQQLVDFQNRIQPGVRFIWDKDSPNAVIKLGSECLELAPPPWLPNMSARCMSLFPGGNPREESFLFYLAWVVGKDGSTRARLTCPSASPPPGESCYDKDAATCPASGFCDGYKHLPCTVNIYFIGNVDDDHTDGVTEFPEVPWNPNPSIPRFVVITDRAGTDARNPADKSWQLGTRTLEHEVGCHYLPRMDHTTAPSGKCPNDLCLSGPVQKTCRNNNPYVVFDRIPMTRQTATLLHNAPSCTRICGGKR